MKNLHLLYHKEKHIDITALRQIHLNSDDYNLTFLATETQIFELNHKTEKIKLLYQTTTSDRIVQFQHLPITNELCIGTESGDVIVLNIDTLISESVTFCDGGLQAMAWSPTQEVVAFVTKTNLLVVMDTSYDPISEHSLDDRDFGCGEFITVGWGKKETQFHGTAGKQAAKQKTDAGVMLSGVELSKNSTNVQIVWRGDGELFAVSFVRDARRLFQVYDKEGQLQFTSEKCNGLQTAIDWRPSGTWIGIPQIMPNKYVITLFEKNGLKHREIVLPFSNAEEHINRIAWCSDSSVLAVETTSNTTGNSTIYLYSMCNYYWYVKQTLLFRNKVVDFQWDTKYSEGKSLHVLLENGNYNIYRWEFSIDHSKSQTSNDNSIVAVIDGKNLLLTNFRQVVIPPPMCATKIQSEFYINSVGFIYHPTSVDGAIAAAVDPNSFFIVDTTNTISIYKWNAPTDETPPQCYGKYLLNNVEQSAISPLALHHWTWINDNRILITRTQSRESILYLYLFDADDSNKLIACDSIAYASEIGAIYFEKNQSDENCVVVHLLNGSIYTVMINNSNQFALNSKQFDLPSFCEKIFITFTSNPLQQRIFALKHKQTLYADDSKLAGDVTSMFLTNNFLAFTTFDQIKFVRLTDGQIINERQIERGGKIVTIVAHASRTILQMPRGNLEAIQPRVLSLCILGDLLNQGNYKDAYDIMRRQRINLNIIVDHNREKFFNDIEHFIDDIDNVHWMNLFLSDLQNTNVTVTMYQCNYTTRSIDAIESDNKIHLVCTKMIEAFMLKDLYKWFLPIITAYVKIKNIEQALRLIWTLKEMEQNPLNVVQKLPISAQEALKYLIYLVDVNELYNIALGMYDFNIVLFVAEKSQKDPKEYLSFLNDLNRLSDSYRRYKIDVHLKRYHNALVHIAACGWDRIDEALELIVKHNLYAEALKLYRSNNEANDLECYKKIAFAFAEYLRNQCRFYDACLMYEKAGDLQQAILSAKHILDWQKCILLTNRLNGSADDLKQMVLSLVPALQENGYHLDAANLVLEYEANVERSIRILCDGQHFSRAQFQAIRLNANHLIELLIKPHLSAYAELVRSNFECVEYEFLRNKNRLSCVRQEKASRQNAPDENDIDECDLLSDTSSLNSSSRYTHSSRNSSKSHRSSKNRRKHERKLLNLKEGNPFEDIALIDFLHNSIQKVYKQQNDVRTILKSLIEFDFIELGVELQRLYAKLLQTIQDSLNDIWIPEMITSGQVSIGENVDYSQYQNDQHYSLIKLHQRFKPEMLKIDWEFEILRSVDYNKK